MGLFASVMKQCYAPNGDGRSLAGSASGRIDLKDGMRGADKRTTFVEHRGADLQEPDHHRVAHRGTAPPSGRHSALTCTAASCAGHSHTITNPGEFGLTLPKNACKTAGAATTGRA